MDYLVLIGIIIRRRNVKLIYKKIVFLLATACLYSENININHAKKKTELGNKYFYNKNFKQSKLMYQEALKIDTNYRPALNNLGMLYYYGQGIDKNLTKAVRFLGKAAIQGNKISQFYLAMSLAEINEEQFNKEIIFWLNKSAKNNYEKAQILLGMAYIKGEHIEKNITKAKYWIRKASDRNSTKAKRIWGKYELWK